MRTDFVVDQADGLRRLLARARHGEAQPSGEGMSAPHFLPQAAGCASNVSEGRNQTWAITLVSGKSGVGRTSIVINLAAALARSGREVLVLDENATQHNVLGRLGLYARHDLLDAAQGKCKPGNAMMRTGEFSVLSATRGMHALDATGQQRMESALAVVSNGMDMVLIDAASPVLNQGGAVRGTLWLVTDATASGITASYALIKRLALEDICLQFGIVVNKVANEQAARTVFENMAKLARRNLAAHLEYLGCIPHDDKLKRATQMGRPVVNLFPAAASAQAYMLLAQKLLVIPPCWDASERGVHTAISGLMKQMPHQFGREIPQLVD